MKKNSTAKLSLLTFILVAALTFCLTAAPIAYASPVENAAKLPRLITVTFYGQNGTKMSFNWNTTDYTDSDVWVVEASDEKGFDSDSVIKTQGEYHISKASKADGFIHTCVVSGLKLGVKYMYKVGDAELNVWSDVGSFVTSTDSDDPFTLIHVSDPQSDTQHYYDIYRETLRSAVNNCSPSFIVNTGDIVNNNWQGYVPNLEQWEWAITDTYDVMKDYPIVGTTGNHEAADYDFASRFNFDIPEGASTQSGVYYSFNYNNAHFTAINTNDTTNPKSADATGLSDEQLNWIKQDLEANKDAKWKVVLMHKAIYDCGDGGNNTLGTDFDVIKIRDQLAPLFSQYGVDLVLQGHDHLYSKSYPLSVEVGADGKAEATASVKETVKKEYNGATYDFYENPNGTIYINSGSASGWKVFKPVEHNTDLIEKAGQGTVMYTAVTFDGDNMFVRTYTIDGKFNSVPYYSFGVTKTAKPIEPPCDIPEEKEFPAWAIALICVGCALVIAGIAVTVTLVIRKRQEGKLKEVLQRAKAVKESANAESNVKDEEHKSDG